MDVAKIAIMIADDEYGKILIPIVMAIDSVKIIKLGIFNHQPFYRKQKKSRGKNANPFMGNYYSLYLSKFYCRELLIRDPFIVEIL